jgi:ATP-dependent RNA helicase DBP3
VLRGLRDFVPKIIAAMTEVDNGTIHGKTNKKRRREEAAEEPGENDRAISSKNSKEERRKAKRLKKKQEKINSRNGQESEKDLKLAAIEEPGPNPRNAAVSEAKEDRGEANRLKKVENVKGGDGEGTDRKNELTDVGEHHGSSGGDPVSKTKAEKREAKRLKKPGKTNGHNGEPSYEAKVADVGDNVVSISRVPESDRASKQRKEAKRLKKLEKLANGHTLHAAGKTLKPDVGEEENGTAKTTRKAEKAQSELSKNAEDDTNVEKQSVPSPTVKTSNGKTRDKSKITTLTPSSKEDYREDPSLSALPQAEIDTFLATNFITVKDPSSSTPLRPITQFTYLPKTATPSHAPFKSFNRPTPIQSAAWPFLLSGRDVIGVAETGSGKTLAFGVPCIRSITASSSPSKGSAPAKAVIVSPTRELAVQIHTQIESLAIPASLSTVCVYGGVPKDQQRSALKTAHIIVATPGRLNDLINEGAADLSNVNYCVLDEADRMLDKGFEEEIRKIISTTSTTGRQTLMFTATWPPSVRDLAATFMTQPVHISIGEDNPTGELRANTKIKQIVEVIDPDGKEQRLLQILKQHQGPAKKNDRILVFCLYKKEAARIESFLRQRGLKVVGIHGDMGQAARQASLDSFKSGTCPLLVATDVAARGLDIPAVKVVVNVTFPLTVEDYVHRIGRTGRAGAEGLAITLFTDHDKAQSGALINVLRAANQEIPEDLLKFGTTVKKKGHEAYGAFYKETGAEGKKSTKIKFDD